MKKNFLLLFLLCIYFTMNAQYVKNNIELLGHWYNPAQVAEPVHGIKYNGVWGWVDPADNKEYAIIGSGTGTHIIEVTNPLIPVERDFVQGRRNLCIWREFKTYGNYLYAISDDGNPNSFQIIDLSYLPDSVHVIHDDTTIFRRAHTLFIDGDKLYCASVNAVGAYHSMALYSLADPTNPVLLRGLEQDYPAISHAHDMWVRNDTVYASCGYQGLFIYKYNPGPNTFSLINSLESYPDQGYNHSSAVTPDGKTLVFCDEVPDNMAVKILDITDITNIEVASTFKSNEGATAHNPYIYGNNRAVIAYYQDGLQIFNISNPAVPLRCGYFDTDTLHGLNDGFPSTPTYQGAWGVYPELPSGNFLVSDMQNGLYVLDVTLAVGINESDVNGSVNSVYPNPTSSSVSISLDLRNSTELLYELYDVTGRAVHSITETAVQGSSSLNFDMRPFPEGIYLLRIQGTGIDHSEKIIKK